MADHFYGVDIGSGLVGGVSTGTATTSKGVELRVHDGVSGNSTVEVLKALEAIKVAIETGSAPA